MNKTELVAAIAEKAELSKKDAEGALKAFIDVVTSFNQLDDLDISEAYTARKTPVAVLLLDHEDGNSTIEPLVYNDGTKKWVHGIPIDKFTKACTEEFVHDWKEAHNK